MDHQHSSAVIVGSRQYLAGFTSQDVGATLASSVEVAPQDVGTIELGGVLQSLALRSNPQTGVSIKIGDASFDLSRGPIQWRRDGHFPDAVPADPVDVIEVFNTSNLPVSVEYVIGFEVTQPMPVAEAATE